MCARYYRDTAPQCYPTHGADDVNVPREFAPWLRHLAKRAGYDLDTRGGQGALADAAGINRTILSRTLSSKSRPSIDTLRALAPLLPTTLRELLVRSGWTTEEELPAPDAAPPPPIEEIDLYAVARKFGIASDKIELFVRIVESNAEAFAHGRNSTNVGGHTQTGGRFRAEGE